MPNPTRTTTISAVTAFTSAVSMDVQYQEAIYALKEAIRQAGTGVTGVRSSDGTTVGDADNWTSAAALGFGAAGSGAWYTARLGCDPGGTALYVLLYINDTSGTPQVYGIRMSTAAYTGGNASTLPTTIGVQTVINTQGDDIIPWNSAIAGSWVTGYNTTGDFWIAVKAIGQNFWRQGCLFICVTDADGGGSGGYRFALWTNSQGSALPAWTITNFNSNVQWEGINDAGTVVSPAEAHSTIQNVGSWTNGFNSLGEMVTEVINLYADQTAANGGRYLGQHPDVQMTEASVAWGTLDDAELGQTYRRTVMGDGNSGIVMYFRTADFPIS